eukprot:5195860-Pleurochrysis_carterae.AAC.2
MSVNTYAAHALHIRLAKYNPVPRQDAMNCIESNILFTSMTFTRHAWEGFAGRHRRRHHEVCRGGGDLAALYKLAADLTMVWYGDDGMVWYGMVWYGARRWYGMVLDDDALQGMVRDDDALQLRWFARIRQIGID